MMPATDPDGRSSGPRVLLVDDDPDVRRVLRKLLHASYTLIEASTADEALRAIHANDPEVLLLDLDLGKGPDGFAVLDHLRKKGLELPVIILSSSHDTDTVVRAMKAGAVHYVGKTPRYDELLEHLRLALLERRRTLALEAHQRPATTRLIGESDSMTAVRKLARSTASSDLPVLILGETGTGKGLVARCIHEWSERQQRPYKDVNVAGLPSSILDSELFGHERGAFTGADSRRRGLFELASGGTILLDEIGDLGRESQIKLLKVVEEGKFSRLGSESEMHTEARILAATHQDLDAMVDSGTFRRDLYHRLAGVIIEIPPLRSRADDIPLLAREFLGEDLELADDALGLLTTASWPGNVRQLQQTLKRAALFAEGGRIDVEHVQLPADTRTGASEDLYDLEYDAALRSSTDRFRRDYLTRLLDRCRGNVAEAARRSGLSRQHLHELIKKLDLRRHHGS